MDTMNFWMNGLAGTKNWLRMVDVLMVNDAEARQLTAIFFGKSGEGNLEDGP